MDFLFFSLFMLAAQFSPGPDMLLLLRNALTHPRRAGLFTVLGISAGLCLHTCLALAGLAVLVHEIPGLHAALLLIGGTWLGWLALRLLRSWRPLPAGESVHALSHRQPLSDRAAFLQGFLTNLTNVKAILFIGSILVTRLGAAPTLARKVGFFAIVVGQALVFWSLFVCALQHSGIQRHYRRLEPALNLAFGGGLLLLAARALWDGVQLL